MAAQNIPVLDLDRYKDQNFRFSFPRDHSGEIKGMLAFGNHLLVTDGTDRIMVFSDRGVRNTGFEPARIPYNKISGFKRAGITTDGLGGSLYKPSLDMIIADPEAGELLALDRRQYTDSRGTFHPIVRYTCDGHSLSMAGILPGYSGYKDILSFALDGLEEKLYAVSSTGRLLAAQRIKGDNREYFDLVPSNSISQGRTGLVSLSITTDSALCPPIIYAYGTCADPANKERSISDMLLVNGSTDRSESSLRVPRRLTFNFNFGHTIIPAGITQVTNYVLLVSGIHYRSQDSLFADKPTVLRLCKIDIDQGEVYVVMQLTGGILDRESPQDGKLHMAAMLNQNVVYIAAGQNIERYILPKVR